MREKSAVCAATPGLEAGLLPRKEDPRVVDQDRGLFLPEWREPPLGRLLQDLSGVWTDVIFPRRYLRTPDETVYGGTGSGGEELSATTGSAAVCGHVRISGRPQSMVRATATILTVAAVTAVATAAAATAATTAVASVAVTAAVIVTATTTAAAAAVAATAATTFKGCCPGAEQLQPGPADDDVQRGSASVRLRGTERLRGMGCRC